MQFSAVFYLCFALLPVSIARPYQHTNFHKYNRGHKHHLHHPVPATQGLETQIPLIDPDNGITTSARSQNSSEVLIGVHFTSVSEWPKSGEDTEVFVLPLGRWVTPGTSCKGTLKAFRH